MEDAPDQPASVRVKAEDIKHPGRLTYDQILCIPIHNVYEWVRNGLWKPKDFRRWLDVVLSND